MRLCRVLIAYAQRHPLNTHAGLSSGTRSINVGMSFIIVYTSTMRTVRALARLHVSKDNSEPPLLANAISAKISRT